MRTYKNILICAAVLAVAWMISSCEKDDVTPVVENQNEEKVEVVTEQKEANESEPDTKPFEMPSTRLSITDDQERNISPGNDFTFHFFAKAFANPKINSVTHDVENMFLSPLSVQFVCGMIGNQVSDNSALCAMLGIDGNISDVNKYFGTLVSDLEDIGGKAHLTLANALMRDQRAFTFDDGFVGTLKNWYHADYLEFEAKSLKDQPVGERPEDLWCQKKTDGMIGSAPDPIIPYGYSLFNAICFKGEWVDKFDPENTIMSEFFAKEKDIRVVPMMRRTGDIPYYSDDNFSSVSLPMGDGSYHLTVMLPQADKSIGDVIGKMDADKWTKMRSGLEMKDVALWMPRFTAEFSHYNLWGLLDKEFLTSYSEQTSELLKDNDGKFNFFNAIAQKAVFKVDEDGTSAAVVTQATEVMANEPGESKVVPFIADRPFVYIISEAGSGLVLFMGTYSGNGAEQRPDLQQ